jgi:hypothetical protein
VKFSGDQGNITCEHIGQFLAQLGELVDKEAFYVRLFSLSLIGTAFAWYATLPRFSIFSWGDLEQKFHDHFFSDDYELDIVDLVALRQGKDESVNDYIQRFWDTRNRCFQIHLAEKRLTGLAFNGLHYYLKEILEGIQFFTLVLGRRRRRYPSRELFVDSLHQRMRDDWRGCPSSSPLQGEGPSPTASASPTSSSRPKAHVEFGPL